MCTRDGLVGRSGRQVITQIRPPLVCECVGVGVGVWVSVWVAVCVVCVRGGVSGRLEVSVDYVNYVCVRMYICTYTSTYQQGMFTFFDLSVCREKALAATGGNDVQGAADW